MRRLAKWLLVSLAAAALAVTLTMSLGWSSSSLANDLTIIAANDKATEPPPPVIP